MKLLVLAADAQSGAGAGRKGGRGNLQWHVDPDPASVEAWARGACTEQTCYGPELYLHAVPNGTVRRGVQCSLP